MGYGLEASREDAKARRGEEKIGTPLKQCSRNMPV